MDFFVSLHPQTALADSLPGQTTPQSPFGNSLYDRFLTYLGDLKEKVCSDLPPIDVPVPESLLLSLSIY